MGNVHVGFRDSLFACRNSKGRTLWRCCSGAVSNSQVPAEHQGVSHGPSFNSAMRVIRCVFNNYLTVAVNLLI